MKPVMKAGEIGGSDKQHLREGGENCGKGREAGPTKYAGSKTEKKRMAELGGSGINGVRG